MCTPLPDITCDINTLLCFYNGCHFVEHFQFETLTTASGRRCNDGNRIILHEQTIRLLTSGQTSEDVSTVYIHTVRMSSIIGC